VGGYMVVDDVQLPSVSNLYNFLKKEKNWTLETVIDHTAFFVKHSEEVVIDDWQNQGINDFYKKFSAFKQFIKSVLKPILKK
jgi:hypothetical protein